MLILIVKSFGSTNKGVDRVHNKYLCTIDVEYMLYKKIIQQRSCWVRPWLSEERRLQFAHYDRLMEDQQSFFNFLRMPPEMFGDELLNKVGPRIRRVDLWVACFNEKISTEVRIFGGILFRRNGRNVNVTGTY